MMNWRRKITVLFGIICIFALLTGYGSKAVRAEEILTGRTASEISAMMGLGWNVGNTFDATGYVAQNLYGHEESWGNPKVTKELIDAVAAAGFKTLRIPITWTNELKYDGKFTIRAEFLERIREVIDYAYANDMFVIINLHHESWINRSDLDKAYFDVGVELDAVWRQLAEYFSGYDQHLIFEAMNEPRMAGTDIEWTGKEEAYEAINFLNQVFTDAIRSNGKGHNPERCLMIPQYAASCSGSIMSALSLPTYNGEAVNNLMVSVHSYTPYDFCLSDKSADFDLNNSSHTGGVDAVFSSINNLFLSKGIPVVMGETGATNTKDNTEARERWAAYTASVAASYGVPIVIWDNGADGNSGGECHAWINRETCEWNYPTVVKALTDSLTETEWGSALAKNDNGDRKITSCCGIDSSAVIWQNSEGLASTKEWDYTYIQLTSEAGWYAPDREIYITYKGKGEPKIVLDSEAKQAWWIPVDPDSITDFGDYRLAKFSYASLLKEMNANGVDNASQLRNFCILAANGSITAYEAGCIGGTSSVTFKANGKIIDIGSELPEVPEENGFTFEGWYSSIDYRPGTEYNGSTADGDMTVYAKYSFKGLAVLKAEADAEKQKKEEDLPPIFAQNKKNNTDASSEDSEKKENAEAVQKTDTDASEKAVSDSAEESEDVPAGEKTTDAEVSDEAAVQDVPSSDDGTEEKSTNRLAGILLTAGGAVLVIIVAVVGIKRRKKV